MADATCKTCPFWECSDADRKDASERRCRVRSPAARSVAHRAEAQAHDAVWPWTKDDEWCGEHPARQRDRLAAMAMQGLATMDAVCGALRTPEAVARDAYAIADAMFAARGEEPIR
jgi:hypothetical protein